MQLVEKVVKISIVSKYLLNGRMVRRSSDNRDLYLDDPKCVAERRGFPTMKSVGDFLDKHKCNQQEENVCVS